MPTAAQVALAVGGPGAHALAWWAIRVGRASIWTASGATMAVVGAVALVTGPVRGWGRLGIIGDVGLGIAAGAALWLATAGFMALAVRFVPPLASQTASLYGARGGRPLAAALAGPLLLSAPGEELLWRGVVLGVLTQSLDGSVVAAVAAWGGFVAVNVVSGSLPIVLGAVVGGAVWTALAWWTGGVAAPIACHVVWTALMIAIPPAGGRP
jgi:membrane protease YdiL (CAAX protease family)